MSYPRYNPFTPGKQISSQGQNDLSTGQTGKDPVRTTTYLGPESSFSSPVTFSGTPCMPEGGVTAQPSFPTSNRLETSGTVLTNISKSTTSICVREETRHQSDGQGAFFTSTQRDISSTTWVSSNQLSSTSQGHQDFRVCSGSSSLNWLPNYKKASEDSSKSTSNRFDPGDPAEDLPVAPQLAVSILMNYGLDEEDLDELLNYPEEQTTAENLPHTLHKIRMKKTMRAPASVQSDPGSTSHPTSSTGGMNRLNEIPQGSCQPSKVIDRGHAGKCFSEAEDKISETLCQTAKTDESMLMMDCIESKTHNEEVPQRVLTEVKSSGMVSSDDKMGPVASLNLKMDVVAPPSSGPTKLQASPNKTLHKIFTMLSLPSKYRDTSGSTPEVLKSVPSKEPVHYFASKSVQSSSLGQGVDSGQAVLVQMGSSDSYTNGQTKIQQQGSNIAELMKNQQMQHQIQPKLVHPPVLQMGQALQSTVPSVAKPDPPSSFIPTYSDASRPFLPSAFNDPGSSIIQPFQPVLDLNSTYLPFSRQQSSAKNPASKGLPPLAMMHDFAAVTPRVFSHTCSLCKTECEQMKDWIFHQNTSLHLENCRRLREQYPEWGGELPLPSAAGRSAKTSTSGLISKNYHQKAKRESRSHSRSRSYSPCPRRSRNGHKKSRSSSSSCSYSPRRCSSKDRRFKSNSSRSRSCSYSPQRRSSRDGRDKFSNPSCSRSYSPRRRNSRDERDKSSSSSCSHSYSPCCHSHSEREKENHGNRPRSLHSTRHIHRSRSSSDERRSPPKRKYRKVLSPGGSPEQRWSPRRSHKRRGRSLEQQLSPRSDKKRRSPKSSHAKYLSPRWSQERHLSPKRFHEKRWSPTKKREQQSSPRKTDEKRWSPVRSRERQSSPTTNYEKRLSPKRSRSPTSYKQSQSRRDEEKHSQPKKSGDESSSLTRSRKRRSSLEESSHKKKLCSVEMLEERLLENPVVQSLSEQPDIKDMVKLMIPVVLAELANSAASSSIPSSSQDKKRKASSPKSVKEQPKLQRTEINSSSKHKLDKPSPPTMVKLKGVFDSLSHNDVVAAVELFGKTKSVLMLKFKQEATICFEKKEDAEKLRCVKNLDVKGVTLTVVTKKGSDCETSSSTENQKMSTQQKSAETRKSASAQKFVLLPIKSLISLPTKPKNTTAVKLVKKAKILGPKEKDVSIKQVVNTVKTGNVAVKTVEGIKTSKPLGLKKFKSPKKTAGSGESKRKAATGNTKRKDEDSDVELNKNTKVKKTSRATVAKPIKVKSIVTMAKSYASKTDKTLKRVTEKKKKLLKTAKRSPKGKVGNVSGTKVPQSKSNQSWLPSSKEVEKTSRNIQPSECPTSENHSDGCCTFKAENLEAKVEEYPVEPEDSAKVNETRIVTSSETNQQSELEVDTETETLKHEETGVKGSAEDKPLAQASQTLQITVTTPETVKGSPQVQPSSMLDSDSGAQQPKTTTNVLQQQTTESVATAALEAAQIAINVDTETNQKEETAAVTKTDQDQVLKPLTAAVTHETKPNQMTAVGDKKQFAAVGSFMTIGENIKWYLSPGKLRCKMVGSFLPPAIFRDDTLLLITNLPGMDSYTEADVVNLLCNFGFEYEHDNIYIIPQSFMAFVLMPNQHAVMNIIRESLHHRLILQNKHLLLHIVGKNLSMNPLCFYKALMELTPLQLPNDGTSLIYIRNISQSETSDLKDALRKIGSVTNYLPLLNKVFIEFHSMHDADRLGVWYSFLKRNACHIVERIKLPRSPKKSKPPQLPMNALPDVKLIKPGAEIPNAKYGIPQGTTPPFWITMTTNPYVFSTASPWFNIPDFLTPQGKNEPFITYHLGSGYRTVMLTGLPEGNYRHEDVAKLVWRYFPKQNLQTLYYNILVLPLQRRAFVYFCSREACCSFVRDHYKKPVSVGNRPLQVHFILQDIRHESSEAMMYRTLMKWSNAHISEIDFLEKRLLCVELSEMSVDLVKKVTAEVASISRFVNFLPLANRICIEMAESSGVRKVLDEISLKGDLSAHKAWSKVLHVETVKDLKQRLQDSSDVTVNLEMNVSQVGAKPRAVKTGTQFDSDKPAASAESNISKAGFKERDAEPANISESDKPEDRAPEHHKTSEYEVNPEEQATKPLTVYETENKQEEARVPETVKASKPEVQPDKEATKPSDVSKSVSKPDERTAETSKATKAEEQVAKPANASTLDIKPEENVAKSTTEDKRERVPKTIKASQPEVKPGKPATKPSNVSKAQIKPDGAPEPSKVSQPEMKPEKPATKPPAGSTYENKHAPETPKAPKPDNKPVKQDVKLLNASNYENKPEKRAPELPKTSVPGIKTDEPATKPVNVPKPEIKPEEKAAEPSKASQPEIKLDKPTTKPSNVSKPQIKPDGAPEPSKASKPEIKIDKPTTNPSNVSKPQIKPDGAPEPSKASKPEIKIDKPTTNPSNVSKPQIKPDGAPEPSKASKPEIKIDKPTTKPSNVSKPQIKPDGAPEPSKTSKPEIKIDKPTTKPSNVSKPQIKPDGAPEPSKASKPEIKPENPATKLPAGSTSENKYAPETPNASIPEIKSVKQDANFLNASNCDSKPEKRAPEPPTSVPGIKSDIPATKPVNVSKPEIKPEDKAAESSKASQPVIKLDKPTTNPSNVSASNIKSEEKAAKPPIVSKSENKQEEDKAPEPPNMSVPGIKTDKAATKPEIKPEVKNTEPPECASASKAESVSVTPPHQSFKETSAAAGPGTAVKTQNVSALNAVSNISTSSAIKTPPAAATTSAATLTFGEKIESLLIPQKIPCLGKKVIMSPRSSSFQMRLLLITNLPERQIRRYTEHDFVKLLQAFGFHYEDKHIYILPRACLAFVLMPSFKSAKDVFVASTRKRLTFLGSQLVVQIINKEFFMTPFGFYKSLLKEINFIVKDDGTCTIYITNISPEDVKNLRETLNKIKSVKNFLPLLNKVFIEFESSRDADRIGVWYSLLKRCPAHNLYRMKIPRSSTNAHAPRLAANALPDSEDMVAGAIAPTTNLGVPPGSTPPFSVTLTTHPFVFPTFSPWFIIPAFRTVETKKSLWKSVTVATKLSTVMLTGLPEGNYRHEDVAKLVWRYFPKQNLQTLYYNILVLPLQRRAFVYFIDWKSCLSFLEDSINNPVSIKDHTLHVHLVLQDMHPGSSEEIMYRSLMKWSNSHVPELESLQERLLCVELSETSVHLIITVMKCVTSIAPIVSFLPLANRICIEMSEPSGVKQAMEKISSDITRLTSHVFWCKVRRVESLSGEYSSLKRRLQDCSEMTINLDQGTKDIDALKSGPPPSEACEKTTQPASQGAARPLQVVPASKEGTASTTQTPQTSSQNLAATKSNEKLNQTAANTLNVPSKSSSEKPPDASEKGEGSSVGPQDTNGSSEAKGEEPVDAKASPAKPATDPSQRAQTALKSSVEASSEAQEPIKPNPESTAQELKPKTVTSQKELQTAGRSDIVENGRNPSKADKVSAVATEAAASAETKSTAEAGGQTKPDPATGSAAALFPTPRETIPQLNAAAQKNYQRHLIRCLTSRLTCVEKSESSGVKQGMEKISSAPVDCLSGEYSSLKRRLQDCSEMTINLDQGTKDIDALKSGPSPSEACEKTTQPASQGAAKPLQVVPASKEGTASTTQTPQTSSQSLAATGSNEKLNQTTANTLNVPSKSSSGKPPDASGKGEGSSVGPQDTNGSSEAKGEEPVDAKASPAKPATDPSQRAQTALKSSVKASSEAQEPITPNPESTPTRSFAPSVFLTPREKIPQLQAAAHKLYQRSLKPQVILSNKLLSIKLISLVITKLPEFTTSCYTEADIINLLHKYEIQCENDKLFIIPQAKMAFVFLPDVEKVQKFFKESKFRNVFLKGSKLFFSVISISNSTPLGLYTFLKSLVGFRQRITDPTKVVYIQNISQSQVADLWMSVKRAGRVMNYLPLLNKVFVEFVDICDADRLGVCYSFLKQRFPYSIHRMGLPHGLETSKAPRQAPQALPHRSITTSRASVPTAPSGIPKGTVAPFWVTMTTNPYVFPTVFPWFNIPAFFTVRNIQHIKKQQHARFPVIMLTGLPNESFTHEDVAMLVWKYFPEQNLFSLYYDVVVLPLQRRAFVHFKTWAACFRFLQDHFRNPVCLKNCALDIHIVLNVIHLRSCEENLYKILMKWSNIHVPDQRSLEERLLCVEVSGMTESLVSTVMKEVASIATFISFLPLANRICIEMAESSGVREVVENLSVSMLSEQCETWKQVGRIESLKSRKLRLQDCKRIAVNLEKGTIDVFTESTVKSSASSDKKTPETSSYDSPGSTVCEPASAGPSGTAIKEESTEVTVCSTVDPKSNLKAAEKKKEESVPCCPLPPGSQVQPHVDAADLPSVNMDHFRALKEAINQYKLSKEAQGGTEDVCSSATCAQPDLDFEDFVTIDEINESVEEKDVDNSSSSLKPISREKRGDQGLDASSETSPSSSFRITETRPSSEFTSVSVESENHSPEPNKSQTNPLSSTSDSKTAQAASSSESAETHVSPGQEASQSSSATAVKTSVGTHQSHEKEDKTTTAESSTDMGPPAQGQKVEVTLQTQKVETEFRDETPKEGKMSKRKEKLMDGEHKVSEERGKNTENYQTVDGQTDEQINQDETQIPGPEKDQVLHQGGLQASDGAEADETSNVKDKHNATEDESATAEEKKHLVKDEGSTVKTDQTRVSETEENQSSRLKQDGSLTGDRETVKDNKERVSEDPVQDESVSKKSVRRSTRGTKDQMTTRDKVTSDGPTIMTRSTRGRRKITADESKERETPMKPRRTPVRDLQKPSKEDSPKTKDITTTKSINTVRDLCEPKTSRETSEDVKEKEQEAPTPRKRGRPRKGARPPTPVPVRKSTRGITLESPDGQTMKGGVEELKEGCSLNKKNVLNKRKMKLVEPEAKRSRSWSPRVAADVKLPPFSPENPLGKEFVSRKWGYFCHLCSVSYLGEGTTKDQHCSSQTHHENLQKYHQKLRQKPSRISTQKSQ